MTMSGIASFIRVDDGSLLHVRHFRANSKGPTCLLIHGYGEGGYVWDETCKTLTDFCSVAVLDLRGHGESHKSSTGRYDLSTHVADAVRITQSLGVDRIVLIGHSLGGQIAMRIAVEFPTLVAALVLVDISSDPNRGAMRQARANLRASMRTYSTVEEYKEWLMKIRPLISAHTAQNLAVGGLRLGSQGFELKIDPALVAPDTTDIESKGKPNSATTLKNILCPSLLIRGAGSALLSASSASHMVRSLRNGQLITINGAGHAVMSDAPQAFNRVVRDFMKTVQRAGA
jgi:pimeloyl-ACP methyl ester carboxylesterase